MLHRDELEKSGQPGFNAGQKEKDYVQHWLLSYLGRDGFLGAFKGGTALQKAYLLPRYSEDLDFTLNGANLPDFEAISRYLLSAGFGKPQWKRQEIAGSISAKLRVQGPLYNGRALSECSVSLDFSGREKAGLAPSMIQIKPAYPDIMPYSILVMDRKEIAAEKVRAILTRKSARDLYDLYFLLKGGFVPEIGLVDEKLSYYGKEYSFSALEDAAGRLSKIWKAEMSVLVAQVPGFEEIKGEALGLMKDIKD